RPSSFPRTCGCRSPRARRSRRSWRGTRSNGETSRCSRSPGGCGRASIHRLRPAFTATTVGLRDGRTVLHHGAYADSNEQIAACLVIEVANLDAALNWAERCPAAASGAVEVRPVFPDDARGGG